MCGWSHTRGTWRVGFFPGVEGRLELRFLYAIARTPRMRFSHKQNAHDINKINKIITPDTEVLSTHVLAALSPLRVLIQ